MILLNLGNKNNMQLPSKLYELIGMGAKIVNFHYNVDKQLVKILNNYPNYININLDKHININNLWNFIKQPKKINFPQHYYKKKFKKNLVEYISNLFIIVFISLGKPSYLFKSANEMPMSALIKP